jgi:hypothetical protein
VLEPLANAKSNFKIVGAAGNGDGKGTVRCDDFAKKAALLGLNDGSLVTRGRRLNREAVVLQVLLYVRLQGADLGALAFEVFFLVT